MTDTDQDKSDDIALAGEYALHLLDNDARRAFENRLAREPALRQLLREWDEGLVTFADGIAPVGPPRHLKGAIQNQLFAEAAKPRRSPWSFLTFGGGAIVGLALAVALLLTLPTVQLLQPGPVYQANIAAQDQSLVLQARLDPAENTLVVDRLSGAALPGRVLELWLIAEGATAPVSLGVLPADPNAAIPLSETLVAALAGGTLAISDEPPGGSPTGQPTGAVLAVGAVTTL